MLAVALLFLFSSFDSVEGIVLFGLGCFEVLAVSQEKRKILKKIALEIIILVMTTTFGGGLEAFHYLNMLNMSLE